MYHKSLLFLLVCFIAVVFTSGCANIVAPTGGPRDSLPPVLISVTPADSSSNFKADRIIFVFNEFVEIQEIQENLIVSPIPLKNPQIDFKLRTVTIKLKDTLEENTTYSINLGNSLRDINEANIYKNFTYAFSTGDSLDLNELSGKVILAETGRPDSTLIALLHRSGEDSAVAKELPRYFARLDSTGNFRFRFLAPGTYHLYALKDEGGSKRYTSRAQTFAFADKPVIVGGNTAPVVLYAYSEEEEEEEKPVKSPAVTKPSKKEEDKRLKFQLNLTNNLQDLLADLQIVFNDSLKTFDSSKLIFADEGFNKITDYTITPDSTGKIYTIRHRWSENKTYNLILDKEFASDTFNRKLLKTDTISFKSKTAADYGSIKLRFGSLDLNKKPVLQILQGDKIVLNYSFTTVKEFYVKLFNPGEYDLRILYDANGNGQWDPGSFFGEHLQPERVQNIEKKLKVRANWDNEENFNLAL
ncbi:MAG: Ig-like domain-containing protein [Chitinophagaceae bacterium]|nr:Ig-like domain-containing protein [Chitinophagaceae bacterium]